MQFRLNKVVKLKEDERKLYLWLRDHRSVSYRLRCSAGRIGLKFNWSDTQASRLLVKLEDKGLIELIQKGTGRKPNLYRVYEIALNNIVVAVKRKKKDLVLPSSLVASIAASRKSASGVGPPNNFNLHPRRGGVENDSLLVRNNTLDIRNSDKDSSIALFSHIRKPPVKTQPKKQGNFDRFTKRYDAPEEWNAVDVVCYYALLSESVRGIRPSINWRVEVGAAKNLLNRYEDGGVSVKRLIQLGFAITPEYKSPESLTWFTQHWVINRCEENWDHEFAAPELEDRFVFAKLS